MIMDGQVILISIFAPLHLLGSEEEKKNLFGQQYDLCWGLPPANLNKRKWDNGKHKPFNVCVEW